MADVRYLREEGGEHVPSGDPWSWAFPAALGGALCAGLVGSQAWDGAFPWEFRWFFMSRFRALICRCHSPRSRRFKAGHPLLAAGVPPFWREAAVTPPRVQRT